MLRCEALEIPAPPPSPVQEATEPSLVTRVIEQVRLFQPFSSPHDSQQTFEQTRFDIDELIRVPVNEPWKSYYVPTDEIEPDNSDWDQLKSAPGIYVVGKCHDDKFYEVAINGSYIPWLHEFVFELDLDYDRTEPREAEVRVHGVWTARMKTQARFLQNAINAVWTRRDQGLELYYRHIAPSQLRIPLEWAILNRDVVESDPKVHKKFAQCLVFLGLTLLKDYDIPPALELLRKDRDELLQAFQNGQDELLQAFWRDHTDLFPGSTSAQRSAEFQRISLLRCLLVFSGGKDDIRQHRFAPEYTASDNVNLYGSLVGITGSNCFGNFDSQVILDALSKSKVFTHDDIRTLDIVKLTSQMMTSLPIGFPQGYLDLPAEVLYGLGTGQVDEIRVHIAHIYRQQSSLKKSENNVLVLLTWSSIATGAPRVLCEWAASDDGLKLHQRLIKGVQDSQEIEQLALTLAALLCRKRLLRYSSNDTTQPIKGSYLADFDALVNSRPLRNERSVFERMLLSFLRVLGTLKGDYQDVCQFLATVLDTDTPILDAFDGFSDQYWVRRMRDKLAHEDAFEMTGCQYLMETSVGLDTDNEDWMILEPGS